MKPEVKYGLIAAAGGFFLTTCVAFAIGLCGPGVALLAGGIAGFLTVREAQPATKNDGARDGAISGVIAGSGMLIGQIVGSVAAALILRESGYEPPIGTMPQAGDLAGQFGFWVGALGVGICLGLIGIGISTGVAALIGYLTTTEEAPPLPVTSVE